MKKSFALLALVPFILFSCQKEVAQNDIDTVVPTLDNGIPTVITCDINQEATRTQYAGNQTFGWTNGDQVRMPLKNGSDQINYYSFTASDANNGDVSAIFYKNKTNENLEPDYDPIGDGWTNLGYLIYPTSIFNFSESQSDGVWNSGNYPVVNLPASYTYNFTNPLNNGFVPMIGRLAGSTYKFSTAVGFIKVTINSMPGATAKVVLESANNSIAGKFAVSLVPENENVAQILKGSATAGTNSITLNVSSVTAGSNHDFYFPLPVGKYDADDLTIKVLDSSNKVLVSRTASKVLNIARNEILELPAITIPYFVSVSGTASAPTGYFTKHNAVIFFTVTDSEETLERSSYLSKMKFSNDGTDSYTLHNNDTGLKNTPSGLKYMHYVVAPYSYSGGTCAQVAEADIIEQDKIPFYYLSSSDNTTYIGNYTKSSGQFYKGVGAEDTSRGALTLSVSADCNKGNVQVGTMLGNRTDTTIPMYGNLSGSTSTFTLFKSPDDATYFFVNGSNYFYVGQSDESLEYETVFSSEINDVTFSLATGETTTLTNNAYIVLYYHNGSTTGPQKRFIQGQNIVYTKNAQ